MLRCSRVGHAVGILRVSFVTSGNSFAGRSRRLGRAQVRCRPSDTVVVSKSQGFRGTLTVGASVTRGSAPIEPRPPFAPLRRCGWRQIRELNRLCSMTGTTRGVASGSTGRCTRTAGRHVECYRGMLASKRGGLVFVDLRSEGRIRSFQLWTT